MTNAKNVTNKPLSLGLKVIIGFHIVSAVLWLFGQTHSIWQHEMVASWGLQTSAAETEHAVIQYDRAMAIVDTLILIPLHAMSAYGLLNREFYGVICSWMAFSLSLYWPSIFIASRYTFATGGVQTPPTDVVSASVVGFIIAFSIWGSWYQCRRNKELLLWWEKDF